jgi:hypothetical protein
MRTFCTPPLSSRRALIGHSALTVGAIRRALPADRTVCLARSDAAVNVPKRGFW